MRKIEYAWYLIFLLSSNCSHSAEHHQKEERGIVVQERLCAEHTITLEQRVSDKLQPESFFIKISRPRKEPLLHTADKIFLKRSNKAISLSYLIHLITTNNAEGNAHFSSILTHFFNEDRSKNALKQFSFKNAYAVTLDDTDQTGILFTAKKRKKHI